MRRVALTVVGIYALILLALTVPLSLVAFVPGFDVEAPLRAMLDARYWGWLAAGLLGQAALLRVPVLVASRRPVTRRALLWPIAATGFLVAGLLIGAVLAVDELVRRNVAARSIGPAIVAGALTWIGWTVVFHRLSTQKSASDVVTRQCRYLLKGSILELLIAVPTHIVARSRDYCCAGIMTFISIAFGVAVMLFSFGPGVFFLYVERWRRLHSEPSPSASGEAA